MRVISGEHKGRRLAAVPGKGTRPTTDKVKESIFNMIGPYFDGGWALDLYAGTGGLGIEALSRGVDRSVFVERDARAFAVVKQNLETCRLEGSADLYRMDADRAIRTLATRKQAFDLVFLDPPYAQQKIAEEIRLLQELDLLADGAWIVAEHDVDVKLPEEIGDCVQDRASTYGDTAVTLYYFDRESQEEISDIGSDEVTQSEEG
ncbi:16S rRNA (guanine(966)-N(2))-methyltransferase RsmD [Brevibacillus choshinensis]|uniref:16S rRNA (Guanine(966)-N(2))-methyltransferase RsmD n=1 Tax=Brevibacillus choshinensis TaxID=54911 RepID=A0ABR5N227_BRECH|nr:16S rRNA (guanine(966)-N(2))-methyltransferase RsmD [Brevibacillus choshinensis]KQL44326.1 16S rRNA (guanine(966)-N(2))-methyltransferase RsmD [Brevibacillus choshinensis]